MGADEKVKREIDTSDDNADGRILDGTEPPKHEYGFTVILQLPSQFSSTNVNCHGTLIAPNIVITAASSKCRELKSGEAIVIAGMHDLSQNETTRQTREVCHVEVHPEASETKNSYMLMYLSDPFTLNDYVGTISLPLKNTVSFTECMYSGWGAGGGTGGKPVKPLHVALKLKKCNEEPAVLCTVSLPCADWGSPLVCVDGNREFAAAIFAKSNCRGDSTAYFASFLTSDFKDWLKEKVNKIPKECHSYHA